MIQILLKLTGVNFIIVLRAAFTLVDPESAKKTVESSSFFALSGSASVKAARRIVGEIDPLSRQVFAQLIFFL